MSDTLEKILKEAREEHRVTSFELSWQGYFQLMGILFYIAFVLRPLLK